MNPELQAFVIVTCAHYAVVAFLAFIAWKLDSGAFLIVALLIALLGGYSYKSPKSNGHSYENPNSSGCSYETSKPKGKNIKTVDIFEDD